MSQADRKRTTIYELQDEVLALLKQHFKDRRPKVLVEFVAEREDTYIASLGQEINLCVVKIVPSRTVMVVE